MKDYTFLERNEERTYDRSGRLRSAEAETFEIMILAGRPWGRLIERNDKPRSRYCLKMDCWRLEAKCTVGSAL